MKLPVLKAAATTLAFFLENWATLLRIVWAPLLLQIAAAFGLQLVYAGRIADLVSGVQSITSPEAQALLSEMFTVNFVLAIVSMLIGLMMAAGVLRFVIRGEKPSLPFYIRWGQDEWALLGTSASIFLGAYLLFLPVTIGFSALFALIRSPWIVQLSPVILACGAILILVRIFPAFPAAVALGKLGIAPAWRASRGQFWRLLGFLVLLWLAWIACSVAIAAIVMPEMLGVYLDVLTGVISVFQVAERAQTIAATAPFYALRQAALAIIGLAPFVVMIVASGIAWRLIDDTPPSSPTSGSGSASATMGF